MKINARELFDYKIQALDGEMGSVHDVFFDDAGLCARYIVVETGSWLLGRKVLIAPAAFGTPDAAESLLPVNLTQQQVKDSPDIASDPPLSREQEVVLNDYYDWPYYWDPGVAAFAQELPAAPMGSLAGEANLTPDHPLPGRPLKATNLRSAREVMGYSLVRGTEKIGEVSDLVFDSERWLLPFLVVEAQDADGKQVLLPSGLVTEIDWPDKDVVVDLSPEDLRDAPAYDSGRREDGGLLEDIASFFRRAS